MTSSFASTVGRGGTFTLAWAGQTTTPLDWDATQAEVAAALRVSKENNALCINLRNGVVLLAGLSQPLHFVVSPTLVL